MYSISKSIMTSLSVLSEFSTLGFDLRVPNFELKSVDALVWSQNEDAYEIAKMGGIDENCLQLLECESDKIEQQVSAEAVGVAIATSRSGMEKIVERFGWPKGSRRLSASKLVERGWKLCGFDVADLDGYFSVFGIDSNEPKLQIKDCLFSDPFEAEHFVDKASKLYPSHAPFAVFALLTWEWSSSGSTDT